MTKVSLVALRCSCAAQHTISLLQDAFGSGIEAEAAPEAAGVGEGVGAGVGPRAPRLRGASLQGVSDRLST